MGVFAVYFVAMLLALYLQQRALWSEHQGPGGILVSCCGEIREK